MRANLLLLVAFFSFPSCSKPPCDPWKRWGLDELASAPGEYIRHCDATRLRWRVVPGGRADAWLDQLARHEYSGWKLYQRRALVRRGDPAVAVSAREDGNDLVVELSLDPALDVEAALRELAPPAPDGGP